jgi:ketosteroid isomerase-like protein
MSSFACDDWMKRENPNMRRSIRMLTLSWSLAMAAGCNQPASTAQSPAAAGADEAAIRAGTVLWTDAYNAGEVDKIVALYTEDAVVMPANAPALIGHAAIKDFLTKDIAAAKAEGLTDKDGVGDVGISGDLAWHAGTSSVSNAAGKTIETGKYIEVWHRINGKWLMIRDIWNDDAPPAPESK